MTEVQGDIGDGKGVTMRLSKYLDVALSESAKATPKIIFGLFILAVLLMLWGPIASLLDRSTEIGVGPVTVKAAEAKLGAIKLKDSEQFELKGSDQADKFDDEQIDVLTSRFSSALAEGNSRTILWVDDKPQNNKYIVDFLDFIGITVVIARSYSEALDRIEERSFAAIVSDWSRPGDSVQTSEEKEPFWGSGAKLAQTLAENGCGRPVLIFSTASTDEMPLAPGISAQTNDYYELLLLIADKLRDGSPSCYVFPN